MAASQKITFEDVEKKRRAFAAALAEFRKAKGRYHNPAPELPAEKLTGCELLPNRQALLDKLAGIRTMGLVGPGDGRFAGEVLSRCCPERLHLFDEDLLQLSDPAVRQELGSDLCRIKPHIGDVSETVRRLPDAFFDVLFIDGDHGYEVVKRVAARFLPKIKPDGAMIFHSYATWSATTMYHCGVARAVHEFCLENPWKFRYLALEPMMYNDLMIVPEGQD